VGANRVPAGLGEVSSERWSLRRFALGVLITFGAAAALVALAAQRSVGP
jgi:hypothetical protein